MRKVVFEIDDLAYYKRTMGYTEERMREVFQGQESFIATFTLYGTGKCVDRYALADREGNKIDKNTLSSYQRGVILNDCYAYFEGKVSKENEVCGVIKITEMEGSYDE